MTESLRRYSIRALSILLFSCAVSLTGPQANAQSDEFDHYRTRFPLIGAHERLRCESCHADGVFLGTPQKCRNCHDGTGQRATTATSNRHIPISGARAECDGCHRMNRWEPARMDHALVTDRCQECHNGVFASAKPIRHVPSNDECGECHRTATWRNARFDHDGVSGPCESCHDGRLATGKNTGHLMTVDDCDLCHSTRRWSPTQFDHSGILQSCSACHNGMDASGIPNRHFATSLECDLCHTTRSWNRTSYDHVGGGYPGDHRKNFDCRKCHGDNSPTVTWRSPTYQPDCAACHASDYERDEHKKHENPDRKYSVSELRDCSGSCHVYTDSSLTEIKKRRSRQHRVSDSEFDD